AQLEGAALLRTYKDKPAWARAKIAPKLSPIATQSVAKEVVALRDRVAQRHHYERGSHRDFGFTDNDRERRSQAHEQSSSHRAASLANLKTNLLAAAEVE